MTTPGRYIVEHNIIRQYGKMMPDTECFRDTHTNRQLSFDDVADLLNKLTDKPDKKGIVNLTLNFYGSDMTPDKVQEIVESVIGKATI